ncbi:MAG: SsrA-binding protein SmpB [Patescibacteria group bacterium]|nr:SsrA-binding protein SmpB [Patescibacteria group bacterium]MDE1945645.1 SsrA-binding protein SmpB [Patescibacteria group bacterium]
MANFAENRKAYFNYDILEKITAGLELLGFEVKSVRAGRMSLDGSYAIVRGGEAFLVGAAVTPLQPKNVMPGYDERRPRKLLLTKKEIARLAGLESKQGLTLVPISVYNIGRKIKLDLGVGRGKKKADKRTSIRKRETAREIDRTLKNT